MELQAVYFIPKNAYRLVVDLTGPDPDALPPGLVTAYTRNHAIAATLLAHGFGVQWKPWMANPRNCVLKGNQVTDVLKTPICEVEIDLDSQLGVRVVSVDQNILEQIAQAKQQEA